MTDNEIIKALEVCSYATSNKDCEKCPYYPDEECVKKQFTDILGLINRQKEAIERLSIESETLVTQLKVAYEQIHKLNMAKSKAIKEFAERLKENYCFTDRWGKIIPISTVDNLVKEMTKGE